MEDSIMKGFISKRLLGYYLVVIIILGGLSYALAKEMSDSVIMMIVFGITLLLVTIIFIYMTRVYIEPLESLSKALKKMLANQYDDAKQEVSDGQVGELIEQMNLLAEHVKDLTSKQRIQAEQLSTIIENSESGLVLINEQGLILFANRRFTDIFGGEQVNYVNQLYYDVINHEGIHEIIRQTIFLEEQRKEQFVLNNVYLDVIGAPIFNAKNKLKGIVLVVYDISELKRLDVMRKDFVANVSHELKTPITSIRGFAETLLSGADKNEEVRKDFLQIILTESERIQFLIDDLLLLSSLERKNPTITIEKLNLKEVIHEIIPIYAHNAEEKNIELIISEEENVFLHADQQALNQLLANLLMNAINYTPQGGKVTLQYKEKFPFIQIDIIDTGIGIPEEELPRLFERFYRVDPGRGRDTGGTGLGLSIVKHIVEIHEGKVEVDSVLGEGTTFTILLPIAGPKED